jgi:competence protein ComEC
MWLGMTVAALAQVPGLPIGPLNAVNEALLGYIAEIAVWFGDPAWAQATVKPPSILGALVIGAVLLAVAAWLLRSAERRARNAPARHPGGKRPPRGPRIAVAAGAVVAVGLLAAFALADPSSEPVAADSLRVTVLDVGQGDAVLLQPGDGDPVLVDTGPPGGAAADALRERGVDRLAAAVITHDESDHAGGLADVLATVSVARLVYARAGRSLLASARAARARPTPLSEGGEIRSGSLRLTALWPPSELPAGPGTDPNEASLVLVARWRDFDMLLTGDAEAEAVPLEPGPIDVLKVSHHGSADAGLSALLDRAAPAAAVISAGDGNPFGHPDPTILSELSAHGIATLRTDQLGDVVLNVKPGGFSVDNGG